MKRAVDPRAGLAVENDQPVVDRVTGEAGDIVQVEFTHKIGAVVLGSLDTDVEFLSDLFGAVTFSDELKDLALAAGEDVDAGFLGFGI